MKQIILALQDSDTGEIYNVTELYLKWKTTDECKKDLQLNSLDIKQEMCNLLRQNLIEAVSDPKLDLSELIYRE